MEQMIQKNEKGGENRHMDELYTIEEMTKWLKISKQTLYRWMDAGIVPFISIGGTRRFVGSQVMAALKRRQKLQMEATGRGVRNDILSDVSEIVHSPTLNHT